MLPETLPCKLCALDHRSQLGPRDVDGKRNEATIGSRLYLFRRYVFRGRKQLAGNMLRRLNRVDPIVVISENHGFLRAKTQRLVIKLRGLEFKASWEIFKCSGASRITG